MSHLVKIFCILTYFLTFLVSHSIGNSIGNSIVLTKPSEVAVIDSDKKIFKKVSPKRTGRQDNHTEPVSIGSFRPFVHAIDSSDVIIIDEKTIEVPDFSYDGEGPASWFVVGNDGDYTREMVDLPDYTVIPDEKESCESLRRYNQETLRLTLPGKMKISDISYLSVYCLRFNHNFGYVIIPDDLKVPKAGKSTAKVEECENVESGESTGSGSGSGQGNRPQRPQRPPQQEETKRPGLIGGLLNLLG